MELEVPQQKLSRNNSEFSTKGHKAMQAILK